MRKEWRRAHGLEPAAASAFGRRRPRWREVNLVVDLSEDYFSRTWWRGMATLLLLIAGVTAIAPQPFMPLPVANPYQPGFAEAEQFRELAIGPVAQGSSTGGRMAANAMVEPLLQAPERAFVDTYASLAAGDTIDRMLVRSGAGFAEAGEAARLINGAAPGGVPAGTSFAIRLGRKLSNGTRPIERVSLRAGLDLDLVVSGSDTGLRISSQRLAVDETPMRINGRVGDGLYWSLRAAGVSAQSASDYLQALATEIDVGADVSPDDRFDLVVANRKAVGGQSQEGALIYAGIDRFGGGGSTRLLKWNVGGRSDWIDVNDAGRQVASVTWPVSAPITSGFGMRYHPILHFTRMHSGIDFGAHFGQPIVATADGQVVRAGWAGGYGQQVQIAHGGGIATTYSHMSRMVVEPGMMVRQGQLIGYVGATGLATGPHLHYEVRRNGTAVNPMSVTFASRSLLDGAQLAAFKARYRQLMALGSGG